MTKYDEKAIAEKCETARKSLIPKGPWSKEDDREEFIHAGYPCVLQRAPLGHWCGYVGIPKDHPDYDKDYDDMDGINIHWGLTYAERCNGIICHKTDDSEDDRYWFGFDCAHAGDVIPAHDLFELSFLAAIKEIGKKGSTYKTQGWVKKKTIGLAEQLKRRSDGSQKPSREESSNHQS